MKIKTGTKIIAFLLAAVMLLIVASCGNEPASNPGPELNLTKDREGNLITIPEKKKKSYIYGGFKHGDSRCAGMRG